MSLIPRLIATTMKSCRTGETGPLRTLLSIVFLVSCGPFADAQRVAEQNAPEDCGEPIPNTQDLFCDSLVRGLAMLLDPYGTEHPDILRERYATHSICAACPCGVEPAQPDSDADQLAELREFLAISPRSRFDAAVEVDDLRYLGVPDFIGLYTPCYGLQAVLDTNPSNVYVIPQTLNVQLSDEHAELNRRAYVYARQYNNLLLSWLICSEEIPLPETTRRKLGISCTE